MQVILVLFKLALIALILGLEIYSLQSIFIDSTSEQDLIVPFSYHFIVSTAAAYILPKIIISRHDSKQLRNCIFFFFIVFYLPALGLIGLILAIPFSLFRFSKVNKSNLSININRIKDFPTTGAIATDHQQHMDLRSLHGLYKSRNYHKRLLAVYATLKLKDLDAIPLLHKALGDPIDDVRLLAYALLDRKENYLSKRIKRNKQALEKNKNSKNKKLILQIVNDYWELVRLGLIQGEAQIHVLNMACKYVETGLKDFPQDLALCFLYAQILLKLRRFEQAYEQLKKSEELGMDRASLQIYYAEIAFCSHQYHEVKQLFKTIELPAVYPKLSAVTQFWQKAS